MIQQPCPRCRQNLKAQDSFAGRLIRCPGCGETLRLPGPAELADWSGIAAPVPAMPLRIEAAAASVDAAGLVIAPRVSIPRRKRWFRPGSRVLLGILFGTLAGALIGCLIGFIWAQLSPTAPQSIGPVNGPGGPALSASAEDHLFPVVLQVGLVCTGLGIFGGALAGAALSDPIAEGDPWVEGATGGAMAGSTLGTFGCLVILVLTAITAFFVALCGGIGESLAGRDPKGAEQHANHVLLYGFLIGLAVLAATAAVGTALGALGAAIGGKMARRRVPLQQSQRPFA